MTQSINTTTRELQAQSLARGIGLFKPNSNLAKYIGFYTHPHIKYHFVSQSANIAKCITGHIYLAYKQYVTLQYDKWNPNAQPHLK